MAQKPVYSLKSGDVFIGDDGKAWTADVVVEPPNARVLGHIGDRPQTYTIFAHHLHVYRRFYHYGSKLVEVKT